MTVKADLPDYCEQLFTPSRYKVLYGGRGGAKSWSVARALLIQAATRPLRILCAREIQRTIADSVHRLLSDQIEALGLGQAYTIQAASIVGANGSEFLFAGLRDQDAQKIKSYEGVNIAWVEEAVTVTKRSWDILIPTIRAEGSEIWVTFNPELDSDETYRRFVVSPPPGAWARKVGYRDNPWFPAVLESERKHMQATDPDEYGNIWEGECKSVVSGAIYAREVLEMIEQRRIRPLPYQPGLKVHTVWDLGWNDSTVILLVQRSQSEVRVIDYIEGQFRRLDEYVADLQQRRWAWGQDWLPHDADSGDLKTGKSAKEIVRSLGRDPRIIPRGDVESGIKAARMVLPRMYVDEDKCGRLVDCLKRYRRHIPTTTGEPARPVHDEYSHAADAVRYLAMVVDRMRNEDGGKPPKTTAGRLKEGASWMSV